MTNRPSPRPSFISSITCDDSRAALEWLQHAFGFESIPRAGGRLCTTPDEGDEFEIGRIPVWEPGRRPVSARA